MDDSKKLNELFNETKSWIIPIMKAEYETERYWLGVLIKDKFDNLKKEMIKEVQHILEVERVKKELMKKEARKKLKDGKRKVTRKIK